MDIILVELEEDYNRGEMFTFEEVDTSERPSKKRPKKHEGQGKQDKDDGVELQRESGEARLSFAR